MLRLKLSSSIPYPQPLPHPRLPCTLSWHSTLTDSLRFSLENFPFRMTEFSTGLLPSTYLILSSLLLLSKMALLSRFPDSSRIHWMTLDGLRLILAPSPHLKYPASKPHLPFQTHTVGVYSSFPKLPSCQKFSLFLRTLVCGILFLALNDSCGLSEQSWS